MDEMKPYEASLYIDTLPYIDRGEWERSRLNMWATVQSQSTKKIKPNDIMQFEWETDQHKLNSYISNDDIHKLQERAQKYLKTIKNDGK